MPERLAFLFGEAPYFSVVGYLSRVARVDKIPQFDYYLRLLIVTITNINTNSTCCYLVCDSLREVSDYLDELGPVRKALGAHSKSGRGNRRGANIFALPSTYLLQALMGKYLHDSISSFHFLLQECVVGCQTSVCPRLAIQNVSLPL